MINYCFTHYLFEIIVFHTISITVQYLHTGFNRLSYNISSIWNVSWYSVILPSLNGVKEVSRFNNAERRQDTVKLSESFQQIFVLVKTCWRRVEVTFVVSQDVMQTRLEKLGWRRIIIGYFLWAKTSLSIVQVGWMFSGFA